MNNIRKLHHDHYIEWGDGGRGIMAYPVWIGDAPNLPGREHLARQLRALSRFQNDVQPNGIVHDIIDPSLNARLLEKEEHDRVMERKRAEERGGAAPNEDSDDEDEANQPPVEGSEQLGDYEQTLLTRGSFQWLPTEIECQWNEATQSGSCKLLGGVPGLPERMPLTESLYSNLEKVFETMMPLLSKLDLHDEERIVHRHRGRVLSPVHGVPNPALVNGILKVVIKAQEYVIPPNSSYSGRWHTEGFSENVTAAGVYYVDIDHELEGGDLSFRPANGPDEDYASCTRTTASDVPIDSDEEEFERPDADFWNDYVKDVAIATGTMTCFQNSIPHRFRSIRNNTERPLRRLFVNFFIIEPTHFKIPTTVNQPSFHLIRRIMLAHGVLEKDVFALVASFVGGYASVDWVHRKIVRDRARVAMTKNRPQWVTLMFGNSGDVIYHRDRRPVDDEAHVLGNYAESAPSSSAMGSGL